MVEVEVSLLGCGEAVEADLVLVSASFDILMASSRTGGLSASLGEDVTGVIDAAEARVGALEVVFGLGDRGGRDFDTSGDFIPDLGTSVSFRIFVFE